MSGRWATFDCYGTIVDWNAGVQRELTRLFGGEAATRLLQRYHEVEPEIQRGKPEATYREVLTMALERLALEEGRQLPPEEVGALANSLPWWPIFADASGALLEAQDRGWKLAILSNTDRDLLEASMETIGVPFDGSIVASEIGSYKPASRHWEVFAEGLGRDARSTRSCCPEPLPRHRPGSRTRNPVDLDQSSRRARRLAAAADLAFLDRSRRRPRRHRLVSLPSGGETVNLSNVLAQ